MAEGKRSMVLRTWGAMLLGGLCASSALVSPLPGAMRAEAAQTSALPTLDYITTVVTAPAIQPPPAAPLQAIRIDDAGTIGGIPKASTPVQTGTMATPVAILAPPLPSLKHRAATRADVEVLARDMRERLSGTLLPDAALLTKAAMIAANGAMERANWAADRMQVVLVVDRSPKVQRLWVTVAMPDTKGLEPLGSVHVSTGKPGRKEHFRTPIGVFHNNAMILGYRAEGTYNENHIRGNGVRGMRVWDFGWQTTDDWRTPRALMAVRMEMHATDPSVLEARLGSWDSEGCIRIPSRFNSFLDSFGLIDAKEREAARDDRRFAALLLKNASPSVLAGQTVVVVDTSDPDAKPSDPARAQVIAHPVLPNPDRAIPG